MKENILRLIRERKLVEVKEHLISMNEVDVAHLLEELKQEDLLVVFRLLPKELSAEIFAHLSHEMRQYIIESITDKEISAIVDNLFIDDTVDIIEELPASVVKKVLNNTNADTRKIINQFLNYPEDSAGSLMTIEFVDFKKEMTVGEALHRIKTTGLKKETINTCYIVDSNRKLEGVLSIRELIINDDDLKLEEIMETPVKSINTLYDQEETAEMFKKYDFIAMPVVDKENRLVGIITIDDIVDIIEEETTEDMEKMTGMQPSETEYLKTGVFTLAKNRIVWLLVLMISATITGRLIIGYEEVLESVVILSSFIPMLMGAGGNAGVQASTLIIRGMALGEITTKDYFKVVGKEIRVAVLVGIVLALVNFLRIYYFTSGATAPIALTIALTLIFVIMVAKIVGATLPMIAKILNLDPAVMAAPLVTTVVDAVAIIIYFNIAQAILGIG